MKQISNYVESKKILTLILVAAFIWSVMTIFNTDQALISYDGFSTLLNFLWSIFYLDITPDFLFICFKAVIQTILYAFAGLSLAIMIAIPVGILSSGTYIHNTYINNTFVVVLRFLLAATRSIHELVWALLLVSIIGLSPLVAVFALTIPYVGILGRIFAEQLRDVPEQPIRALLTNGANYPKAVIYGRIPLAMPNIISYIFYRLECGIRSAAIMSFIGIQGIGYQIHLSLLDLKFGQVWTGLICLTIMVIVVDLWSTTVRKALTT